MNADLLKRALAGGHDICPKGHVYMDGSWEWNKGHKRCLICRDKARKRNRKPR